MAALAVRLESPRPLVLGLVGPVAGRRERRRRGAARRAAAPPQRREARRDPFRLFDEAAGLSDLAGARWLREARDSDDQVEDTGYVEDGDGDEFRYLRTAGAIRRDRF